MESAEAGRAPKTKKQTLSEPQISHPIPITGNLFYKLEEHFHFQRRLIKSTPKVKLFPAPFKMQTALTFAAPSFVPLAPAKSVSHVTSFPIKLTGSLSSPRNVALKVSTVNNDTSTVDYNSTFSVFPAEACETVGGDACLADVYPEARLQPEPRNDTPQVASEKVEREYLEYNDPKTVFLGEACDELGGMFCERDYQKGVY